MSSKRPPPGPQPEGMLGKYQGPPWTEQYLALTLWDKCYIAAGNNCMGWMCVCVHSPILWWNPNSYGGTSGCHEDKALTGRPLRDVCSLSLWGCNEKRQLGGSEASSAEAWPWPPQRQERTMKNNFLLPISHEATAVQTGKVKYKYSM